MADSEAGPLRWARIVGLLLLLVAFAEGLGRVYFQLWAGEPYRSLSYYRWSPYGLTRNNPEITSTQFRINENGFRNVRSFTREKPPGTLRVVLVGGSVLYSGLGGPAVLESEGRVGSDATIAQYLHRSLRDDPSLEGLDLEVINAAVNFNRIAEVAAGYMQEWVFWEPDLVVVFGSANNFTGEVPPGPPLRERSYLVQGQHPWLVEFERTVNERTLRSVTENALRTVEEASASVALARKLTSKLTDGLWSWVRGHRAGKRAPPAPEEPPGQAEIDRYFEDYAGFADAIVAVAQRHDQEIAFFWEYRIGNLKGLKPFTAEEEYLHRHTAHDEAGRRYHFEMRDRLREMLGRKGVRLVDPLDALRQHEETVFIDYLHYTKRGNEFMARTLHQQLRDLIERRAERVRRRAGAADPVDAPPGA